MGQASGKQTKDIWEILLNSIHDNPQYVDTIKQITQDVRFFDHDQKFATELDTNAYVDLATTLLQIDPNIDRLRRKLVPSKMSEDRFWEIYLLKLVSVSKNIIGEEFSELVPLKYKKERQIAIEAVLKAVRVCQAVSSTLIAADSKTKSDRSPVTIADFASQAVIINELRNAFPDDEIIAEEHSSDLNVTPDMKEKVVKVTNSVFSPPGFTEEFIMNAIDYRGPQKTETEADSPVEKSNRFWTIDPIDGTAGFLRTEQYAVCLALVENGNVVLGVLGCPNLPSELPKPEGDQPINVAKSDEGCLLVAVLGQGAFIKNLSDGPEKSIHVSAVTDSKEANFTESVEAGHSSHSDSANIAKILGITRPSVRMDSQCKYAAVARGDATIYLRPSRASYFECIWDHAAGCLIVKEAGGEVTDLKGKELDFTKGKKLFNNHGVVATNGVLHSAVLEAVKDVLFPSVSKYTVEIKSSLLHSKKTDDAHQKGSELITPESLKQALAAGLKIDPSLIVVESE